MSVKKIFRIGIIILSYKNSIDTIQCISSVKNSASEKYDIQKIIIYLDNSLTDKYFNEVTSIHNDIISIQLKSNNGYSAGNNEGVKIAIAENCTHVLVLNNDTIVDKKIWDGIIDHYTDSVAITAPIIYNFYSNHVWSSGGKYRKFFGNHYMLKDLFEAETRDTEFINGCCLFLSIDKFLKLGFFPEEYFMYGEDAEYSKRIIKYGYKIKVIKSSVIYHKVSQSTGVLSPFQQYYIYRNRFLYINRNEIGLKKYFYLFSNTFQLVLKSFVYLFKGKISLFKATLFALIDFNKQGISTRTILK